MTFWTWPTLYSLTGGLVGSAVTFGGALVVVHLSIASDRRQQQDTRREQEKAADQALRKNAALAVLSVRRALQREVRSVPFGRHQTLDALLILLISIASDCRRDHPAVADWLGEQATGLLDDVNYWRGRWWVPWMGRRRLRPAAERVGQMVDAFARWTTSKDDSWFVERSAL